MPPPPNPPRDNSDRLRAVAKYSGMAFQMLAIIGLSTWLGTWLDRHFQTKNPWFTISFLLVGVLLSMLQIIRSLTRNS